MPYKKKQSTLLTKCRDRAMNLQVIHPNLDLGNGLTIKAYQATTLAVSAKQRDTHQANLDNYNRAIATITELALSFENPTNTCATLMSGCYSEPSTEKTAKSTEPQAENAKVK